MPPPVPAIPMIPVIPMVPMVSMAPMVSMVLVVPYWSCAPPTPSPHVPSPRSPLLPAFFRRFVHTIRRLIPDFARELDFLRLLPRGADVDPNDPRQGNVLRLRGLLAALGLGRRESSLASVAGRGESGLGSARGRSGGRSGEGGGDGEEDAGVFRASHEQQVMVFSGKRVTGRGHTGFDSFAYNNHRR